MFFTIFIDFYDFLRFFAIFSDFYRCWLVLTEIPNGDQGTGQDVVRESPLRSGRASLYGILLNWTRLERSIEMIDGIW